METEQKQNHTTPASHKVQCNNCGKLYVTKQVLSKHMRTIHQKAKKAENLVDAAAQQAQQSDDAEAAAEEVAMEVQPFYHDPTAQLAEEIKVAQTAMYTRCLNFIGKWEKFQESYIKFAKGMHTTAGAIALAELNTIKRFEDLEKELQEEGKQLCGIEVPDAAQTYNEAISVCHRSLFNSKHIAVLRDKSPYKKRYIIIDGGNVARYGHNKDGEYDVAQLDKAMQYFETAGFPVLAIFTTMRIWKYGTKFPEYMKHLIEVKKGIITNHKRVNGQVVSAEDDPLILDVAAHTGGLVISNDLYRDWVDHNAKWASLINKDVIQFQFAADKFLIPQAQAGHDPKLHEARFYEPKNQH